MSEYLEMWEDGMTEDEERWIADVIFARSNPYARRLMFKPYARLVISKELKKEYEKALKLDEKERVRKLKLFQFRNRKSKKRRKSRFKE
jgi:hypothetical protein